MIACPPHLQALAKSFLAEEVASVLRHDLRNKMASIRNCTFYLKRKIDKNTTLAQEDPRVPQFFGVIDTELGACSEMLSSKLVPATPASQIQPVDACALVAGLVDAVHPPSGISVSVIAPEPARFQADRGEIELALFCLLENALDALELAGKGSARVRVGRDSAAMVTLEVTDDGPGFTPAEATAALVAFHSTRPGRLGIGLNTAKRIVGRWGGKLEVGPGARAALLLPQAR